MSLTVGGVITQALARVQEVTDDAPSANASVSIRRIALRQQELFTIAAAESHEYNGVSAVCPLDSNGAADLATIADPVPTPDEITMITVHDRGTSELVAGAQVFIVPVADIAAAIPPRVTIRNRLIKQVSTDLALVTSLQVYYTRRPTMYCPEDECLVTELVSPYDELLVIDLAKHIVTKSPEIEAARRGEVLGRWDAEESELLTQFRRHVREYAATLTRFTRPPQGVARPA